MFDYQYVMYATNFNVLYILLNTLNDTSISNVFFFVLNRYKDNNLSEMELSSSIKRLCQIVKRYLLL